MKSSKGDQQKERVQQKKKKKKYRSQSNKHFLSEELPAVRNGACASQVQMHLTGDRPAWCYTLGSPAHPSPKAYAGATHSHQTNAQNRKSWNGKQKKSQKRRGESGTLAKWKEPGIGWKWKYVVMQRAHKQFGSTSGEFKGNSDKSSSE